jgi:hypothetical protein
MSGEPMVVDLTYRGLKLVQRGKLHADGSDDAIAGFVEHEQPLPVGARVQILLEGQAPRDARVVSVVEQEASAKHTPGMKLGWISAAVRKPSTRTETVPPAPVAAAPVVEKAAPVVEKVEAAPVVAAAKVEPVVEKVEKVEAPPVAAKAEAVPEAARSSDPTEPAKAADADASSSSAPDDGGGKRRRNRKKTLIGR